MRYGLLGERLEHSFSKQIHESFWADSYELICLPEDELGAFMRKKEFDGINITIPYKRKVMAYCDKLDDTARKTGCVNTIVKERDSSLTGYNTDLFGLQYSLRRAGITLSGKRVLILGTGATSKTAAVVCEAAGAGSVVHISRRGEHTYADILSHKDSEVIINATPVGMYPRNGERLIDISVFDNLSAAVDVIYNPLRTRLVFDAMRRGVKTAAGLAMLVGQAVRAAELFCKKAFDESVIEAQLTKLENQITNIVLTGMPGSGKSTIGLMVAQRLGRPFFDTDKMVELSAKLTIPEIFDRYGEGHFRDLEQEAVAQAGCQTGAVIAVGGGAVMKADNRYMLGQNGKIYLIKRDMDKLDMTGRPLSHSRQAIEGIFRERIATFEAFCDIIIENNTAPEFAAQRIWGAHQ